MHPISLFVGVIAALIVESAAKSGASENAETVAAPSVAAKKKKKAKAIAKTVPTDDNANSMPNPENVDDVAETTD